MLALPDAIAAAQSACPGFFPSGRARRSIKCLLVEGERAGRPLIAKVLAHPDPIWRWYFERELLLYERFELEPPPVPVPRCEAAGGGVLVLERLGAPLSTYRAVRSPLEQPLRLLLRDTVARLEGWTAPALPPPPPELRRRLRERLLEDPGDPAGWLAAGIAALQRRGILDEAAAALVRTTEAGEGGAHGDLLPRNVLRAGTGLVVADWECAGLYPAGWDRALLWANLHPADRPLLESGGRPPALAAFALAREIAFCRGYRVEALRADLDAALSSLGA